jgi:hypothetical protein
MQRLLRAAHVRWRPDVSVETLSAPNGRARFEQVVLPYLEPAYNLSRWLERDASLASSTGGDLNPSRSSRGAGTAMRPFDAKEYCAKIAR